MGKQLYHRFVVPESRRKINEPIRDDMLVIPDKQFLELRANQLGTNIDLTANLYLGGIVQYRLDSPCIEVYHERAKGLDRILKKMGLLEKSSLASVDLDGGEGCSK